MKIDFVNKSAFKLKRVIKRSIQETFEFLKQEHKNLEVCVIFLNEQEMKDLNNRTRQIDRVTDVLSYPCFEIKAGENLELELQAGGKYVHLGDMAICLPQAQRQADEFQTSLSQEISKLAVHSTLHLMGYDHIKDEDYDKMHPIEESVEVILKKKGII